jgi:hypothetical protein
MTSAVGDDPLDRRSARFLRIPDLRVGRKLEVGDDDLVAVLVEGHRRGDGVDPGRGRTGHGNFIGGASEQSRDIAAQGFIATDPCVPMATMGVAIGEIFKIGGLDRVRQQAIGTAVHEALTAKQREARAQGVPVGGDGNG